MKKPKMKIIITFKSTRGTDTICSLTAVRQAIRLIVLLQYSLMLGVTASNPQTLCKPNGWNDAMLCCQNLGHSYSLPVISTKEDYMDLVENMKRYQINNVWLSLKRTRSKKFTWMDGSPGPGRLNNMPNSTNCGKWNFKKQQIMAGNCGNYVGKGVLCQISDCPGCKHMDLSRTSECVEEKNICYIKDCTSTTWDGGRHFCLDHSSEYISLNTPDKLNAFRNVSTFKTRNCLGAWIGLRRHQWNFIHNKSEHYDVTLPYWLPGEPVPFGDCGYMGKHDQGYGWAAANCDRNLPALCFPFSTAVEFVTTKTSSEENETLPYQLCKTESVPCTYTPGYIHMLRTLPAILALSSVTSLIVVSIAIYYCHKKRKSQEERQQNNESEENISMAVYQDLISP